MATKLSTKKHPKRKLEEVLAEKGAVRTLDKHLTTFKAADGESEVGAQLFRPDDEQLTKINQFTRSKKSADELVCFTTLSCNDMIDRDDDRFRTDAIEAFATLPGDLSPIGKSFMVSHDHTSLPIGRIFDVGTRDIEGVKFLTNDVYIPNTEANKNFIENLDYGVYWAVSVGVVFGATECTVCKEPFSSWGWWCTKGHFKGEWYDPESDEEDAWGFPEPADPGNKNAVKCIQNLFEPQDFYELSQVYLGAQYFAALDKGSKIAGVVKSAGKSKLPIYNLSREEAAELPHPENQDRVQEALKRYKPEEVEDGSIKWADDEGLVWVYEPGEESGSILCLGKQAEKHEGEDGESEGEPAAEGEPTEAPVNAPAEPLVDPGPTEDNKPENTEGENSENEDGKMSKSQVVAAAQKSGLPAGILEQLEKAPGDGLEQLLTAAATQIKELTPKAELGTQFIKEVRAEVIDWYTKAHIDPDKGKGVDTSKVEKLLAACGENLELLKVLREEYKDKAQLRFPSTVRRSSAETDPNERSEIEEIPFLAKEEAERVRKIHGK